MARGLYVIAQLPPIDTVTRGPFNTFTTFADVYGAPQKILPKSVMEPGLSLELEAYGEVSTTGSPTFSLGFYINGGASTGPTTLVAPTTIIAQTQLAAYPVATVTSAPWHAHWQGVLRSVAAGAAGVATATWHGSGYADLGNTVTPFSTMVTWCMPTTLALRTFTADATTDQEVGVGAQWGTSSASNSISVTEFFVKTMS